MAINSTHMVVFSPCGGCANIAKALTPKIPTHVEMHDWTLPKDREKKLSFGPEDLVFLIFPVYGGNMPLSIDNIFANLEGHKTPCALVAVYGNRAFDGALLDLDKVARTHGFTPVAAIAAIAQHCMAPMLATGRPDETDQKNLADFGPEIFDLAQKGHRLEKAPGKPHVWALPDGIYFYPVTDPEKCTRCGICVEVCPTGAIPKNDPTFTDIKLCIDCYACVKNCPTNARTLGNEQTAKLFEPHLKEALIRKEAQLFT